MALHILLIEPYYGGGHRAWADGYMAHSEHDVSLLMLPAQFWKWRMQGSAVTLARLYQERDARLLWQADYEVSTAHQDFFGIAVAEAIYCG